MKYYFYADEKGFVTCRSEQPFTELKFKEVEKENEDGELVKVQEPYEVLVDGWTEIEEPSADLLENFIWYKMVDGTPIKMAEEEFYTQYPNYGREIPSDTEVLGQMATDAELERMELGQRMTDLELMVLEGGI